MITQLKPGPKKSRKLTVVEVATLVAASTAHLQAQAYFKAVCVQMGIDPDKPFHLGPDGELTQ